MRHDRQRRRRRLLVLLLVAMALLLWWCNHPPPLVIGTFNIRTFPGERTDPAEVAAALVELDADAIAVQEIGGLDDFDAVLRDANAQSGRRYVMALSPSCRERKKGKHTRLNLGVVYDESRIELVEHRALTGGKSCVPGQPPAVLAVLRPHGGPPLALASVHFSAGGAPENVSDRQRQWAWLLRTIPRLEAEFAAPVVMAGDFNSTGFLDPEHDERRFIDDLLDEHDLQLPTATLGCSEYWRPEKNGPFQASLLDHVVLPSGLEFSRPEVLGMCAALACAPHPDAPPGYHTISDHCPVRLALHR